MDLERITEAWDEALAEAADRAGVSVWRIEDVFAYGGCDILAVHLHDRLGLPLGQATEGDGFHHAFAWLGGDHCLDALGIRTRQQVETRWKEDDDCFLTDIDVDELRIHGKSTSPRSFENRYAPVIVDAFASRIAGLLNDHQHSMST